MIQSKLIDLQSQNRSLNWHNSSHELRVMRGKTEHLNSRSNLGQATKLYKFIITQARFDHTKLITLYSLIVRFAGYLCFLFNRVSFVHKRWLYRVIGMHRLNILNSVIKTRMSFCLNPGSGFKGRADQCLPSQGYNYRVPSPPLPLAER